jgi:hypothetical protein
MGRRILPTSITKVSGYLRQLPAGASRQCTLVIETQNFGTPDESLSSIIRVNYEIEDQADDFPDGEYLVKWGGGPEIRSYVAFIKSGGRYSEKKSA